MIVLDYVASVMEYALQMKVYQFAMSVAGTYLFGKWMGGGGE